AAVVERARLIGEEAAVDDGAEVAEVDDARRTRLLNRGEDGAGRDLTQAREDVADATAADRRREARRDRGPLRRRRLAGPAAAALADRPDEELLAPRRRDLQAHVLRPGGLAEDRDPLRIAAERGDVDPHPRKRGALVEETLVARIRIGRV